MCRAGLGKALSALQLRPGFFVRASSGQEIEQPRFCKLPLVYRGLLSVSWELLLEREAPDYIRRDSDPESPVKTVRGWLDRVTVMTLFS